MFSYNIQDICNNLRHNFTCINARVSTFYIYLRIMGIVSRGVSRVRCVDTTINKIWDFRPLYKVNFWSVAYMFIVLKNGSWLTMHSKVLPKFNNDCTGISRFQNLENISQSGSISSDYMECCTALSLFKTDLWSTGNVVLAHCWAMALVWKPVRW